MQWKHKFDVTKIEEVNQLLDALDTNTTNQKNVDDIVKIFSNISIMAGLETGISKQVVNNGRPSRPKKQNKPWFDYDSHIKRKQYLRIKNRLRKSKSSQDKAAFKEETKT